MAMNGTSALARVAMNPECELQVAMARAREPEPTFYRRVTGQDLDREYGERISARRRGSKFEQNLHQNNAALLRNALADFVGTAEERIYVRNLDDEVPGAREIARIARYRRTIDIISDAMAERRHPELVVHPELQLPALGTDKGYIWVEPDFMAWDASRGVYVPGDEKSFIVQENDVDPGDLERTRFQIAAQILALRHRYGKHNASDQIANRGLLIFATPYGLRPHTPRIEQLDGAVRGIEQALDSFARHGAKVDQLRKVDGAPIHLLVDELKPHFQEKCMSTCVMARYCRKRHADHAADLGDFAVDMLGPEIELARVNALIGGAPPRDEREEALASELRRIANLFGLRSRAA